jgi:TonB family protein
MRFHMVAACTLSFGLHIGMLLLLPVPSFQHALAPEIPKEVELVTVAVPLPPALQPLPPEPSSAGAPPSPVAPTYDASKIAQPDLQRIDGAIEAMTAGLSVQLGMPTLQLPPQQQTETVPETLPLPPPDTSGVVAALLEPSPLDPGKVAGVDKQTGLGEVRLGTKQSPSRMGLPRIDTRLIAPPLPTTTPTITSPPPESQFGIQGPVAKREPLFRPPLPEVRVQSESDITLKFWVRPDGVVSRVIPERKGDVLLEAAAIRYLESWRFTPLPPHESQEEQWGTITVRFLLPKRGAQN